MNFNAVIWLLVLVVGVALGVWVVSVPGSQSPMDLLSLGLIFFGFLNLERATDDE